MTRKQTREERTVRHAIMRHGLIVVGYARGRHHKFLVKAPDGTTGIVVFPATASDWRATRNFYASLKRLANGEA